MNFLNYILPPLLGGIIALSTNYLAIVMLFRPHKEIRIFGWRVPFTPGLIPKEKEKLAKKLAGTISKKLLSPESLATELSNLEMWELPNITIGEALTELGINNHADLTAPLGERLKTLSENLIPKAATILSEFPEKHPEIDAKLAKFTYKIISENTGILAGMFVSKEKIYKSIKDGATSYIANPENHEEISTKLNAAIEALLTDEKTRQIITEKIYELNIKDALSHFLQKEKHAVQRVLGIFASYLAAQMPIEQVIENRISSFDVAEAEEIILTVAGRELRLIVLLGGVLGFILGMLFVVI